MFPYVLVAADSPNSQILKSPTCRMADVKSVVNDVRCLRLQAPCKIYDWDFFGWKYILFNGKIASQIMTGASLLRSEKAMN